MAVSPIKSPHKREVITAQVKQWIKERRLPLGSRLESQNRLAAYFGVTAVTVHKALRQLEQESVIYREHGRGTFVGPAPHTLRIKTVCLILPGDHLADPEYNPECWPYIKSLYKAFLTSVGDQWSFTTRVVLPGTDIRPVVKELARFDLVVFHHIKEPYDLLQHLVNKKIVPTVAFGLPRPDLKCLTIDHDMVEGSRLAIRHLHENGYRQAAMIASREPWADYWVEGYRKGLADVGQRFDDRLVLRVEHRRDAGTRAAAELLARNIPFDSVYTDSDILALSVCEGFQSAGFQVPGDIGVIGYDTFEYDLLQPGYLASVSQPLEQMVAAALVSVDGLAGRSTPDEHIKVTGSIVPGRTVVSRQTTMSFQGRTPAVKTPLD